MKNIELTLCKIESELRNSNPHAVKTLVDIYKELLNPFLDENYDSIGDGKSNFKDFVKTLNAHKENLTKVHSLSNTKLENYLRNGEYKDAHCITIAIRKLEEAINIIKTNIDQSVRHESN
jgi:hypothetical protein